MNADRTIDFYVKAGMLELVEEEVIVANHVDKGPIVVQRNGKTVYTEVNSYLSPKDKFIVELKKHGYTELSKIIDAYDTAHV